MITRVQVVEEMRRWLNTPYEHNQRVFGAGCDCIGFIAGVFERVGMPRAEIPYYSPQWHLHVKGRQLLLDELQKYCDERPAIETPKPADVMMFWFGHAYSHAALVVEYPLCIHASLNAKRVAYVDADRDPHLSRCRKRCFSPHIFNVQD